MDVACTHLLITSTASQQHPSRNETWGWSLGMELGQNGSSRADMPTASCNTRSTSQDCCHTRGGCLSAAVAHASVTVENDRPDAVQESLDCAVIRSFHQLSRHTAEWSHRWPEHRPVRTSCTATYSYLLASQVYGTSLCTQAGTPVQQRQLKLRWQPSAIPEHQELTSPPVIAHLESSISPLKPRLMRHTNMIPKALSCHAAAPGYASQDIHTLLPRPVS